jgi:PAS domain S-box-containing protein
MDDAKRSDGERPAPLGEGVFREIFHSVNDAIFVQDAETGSIRAANETACEMYGYTGAEMRELTVEQLSSGEPPYTHETATEYIRKAAEGDPQLFEWRALDSDGEPFWVEVSMRRAVVESEPLLLVIVRDITERKADEQELRRLTEQYEAVFERAADAIFLLDVETAAGEHTFRFERLNPSHEAISGLRTEEIRGKTPREVLGEETGAAVVDNYRRCVEAREPITYEESLEMPDGRIVWQTKLTPVVVDDEVTRIVGVARDVTERVEQERALQQQNERLDEFASVISHDLRNPLNVAQGRATLLDGGVESPHLEPLLEALDRMESIVEDTLTLAREGETVSETGTVTMTDVVGQCWGMIDAEEASLEVTAEFTIAADRDRMRHVFENLFRNAVEHGGPAVTVRVGRTGEEGFYVEDTGPGIPESEREAVFEPGHTSVSDGTGFGLAIVRRVAEAHGWQVAVTEGEDGGARFEFSGVDVDPGDDA